MSFENVKNKIELLENKGYLNKGDNSVEYLTKNTQIISRFFSNNMNEDEQIYLKQKLKKFLDEEQVLYEIGYSLTILPHIEIVEAINNSNTYTEMEQKLKQISFLKVNSFNGKIYIKLCSNGEISHFSFDKLNKFCDKHIDIKAEKTSYYNKYRIISQKCENLENGKNAIDILF